MSLRDCSALDGHGAAPRFSRCAARAGARPSPSCRPASHPTSRSARRSNPTRGRRSRPPPTRTGSHGSASPGRRRSAEAKKSNPADVSREGKLLLPRSALPRPAPTPGSYNCRLITLGKATAKGKAFESFKPFFCYVEVEDDQLTIVKQTGSQRPAGRLWEDDDANRLDLPRQPCARRRGRSRSLMATIPSATWPACSSGSAPFRWRLVIPWPQSTSKLDVFELTPVDFTQQPQ